MGLPSDWVNVAERLGPDAFVEVWRLLDGIADPGKRELRVPSFARFSRYQRARLIISLAEEGKKPAEIGSYIRRELGVKIHERTIQRVVASAKLAS